MDLNNLNIEDLKAKVLTFTDKKTLIKSGIAFGAIVFFLIIYYSILNPIVNTKKIQLDDMIVKQKEYKVNRFYCPNRINPPTKRSACGVRAGSTFLSL